VGRSVLPVRASGCQSVGVLSIGLWKRPSVSL
jgi:hypothetical protein